MKTYYCNVEALLDERLLRQGFPKRKEAFLKERRAEELETTEEEVILDVCFWQASF